MGGFISGEIKSLNSIVFKPLMNGIFEADCITNERNKYFLFQKLKFFACEKGS